MTTSSEDEYLSAEEEDEEKKRGPRTMAVASSHSPTLVSRLEGLQAHEASSIRTGRGDQNGESTSRGDGATEASEVAELEEDVSSLTIDRGSTCTARAESFDSEGCDVAMKDKNSRGEVGAEDREANERGGAAAGEGEVEYVGGLDNRDVSEDVTMKGGLVELSEEQVKVRSVLIYVLCNTVAIGPAGSLYSGWCRQETNSYPALTLTLGLAKVTLPNRRRPD